MSDCTPTVYLPVEPYVTVADLCNDCWGSLDFNPTTPAVAADPEADPPVEAVPEVPSSDAVLFASQALGASRRVFMATGGRFPGCVTTTWEPCRQDLCCGRWIDLCSQDECHCESWPSITLPYGPVRSITSVTIDGDLLAPENYRVEGRQLLRTDGEEWPTCDTMTIIYRWGIDLPPEAKDLVAAYARELTKGCKPGGKCAIRSGWRTITIGGATYEQPEPTEYRGQLRTGFDPLDDWIALIMGNHARTRPRLAGRRLRGRSA